MEQFQDGRLRRNGTQAARQPAALCTVSPCRNTQVLMDNARPKVSIIGAGSIGATIAWSLALRCPAVDILLVNRDERRARAKAFDMSHCVPELPGRAIRWGATEDCDNSDVIVLTVGVLPAENGTRADVLRDNVGIYSTIVPPLASHSPSAVFVVVTNPVDAMAHTAWRLAASPRGRVIGTGTALDSLRLRSFLGEAFGLDASRLWIDVIGEHGDTMVPLWSLAEYDGRPLTCVLMEAGAHLDAEAKARLLGRTRRAGWDIRLMGEHSCYGIAFSATRIIEALLAPSDSRLAVSALVDGECGIHGVFMSLPTRLGPGGVVTREVPEMDQGELAGLQRSATALADQVSAVDMALRGES
jgi:L-lactate dehydrogenase